MKMNLPIIKNVTLALVGAFAIGLIACGGDMAQNGGQTTVAPPTETPVAAHTLKYNFYEPKSEDDLKNDTNYGYLIAKTKPGFKKDMFERLGLEVRNSYTANGATYWHLYKESGVFEAYRQAGTLSDLAYIEPEMMLEHHALDISPIGYSNPDPYVESRQWGVHVTKAKEAWQTYGFGPNKSVVVDVDSGIRFSHEDLAPVVRHAWSWYADNGMDLRSGQTGDPRDEIGPFDYKAAGTTNNTDGNYLFLGLVQLAQGGHGTHTAGTIAAVGNNGRGVAGMCWNVDLVSYKAMTNAGSGASFPVYGSIWHLVKWKNEVVGTDGDGNPIRRYPHTIPVNMSLGGLFASQFAIDMVEYGLENNVVICASSGNSAIRLRSYPAAYSGVIAVGASTGGDKRAYFSQWGEHLSVVAPGYNIMSVGQPNDSAYTDMAGTSMACPHVTGLVGYMLTFAPDLKPDQIKTYLERNADKVEAMKGAAFTEEYGHGRINALKTIKAVIDDVNAGKEPDSDYVNKRVKVNVYNKNAAGAVSPVNGVVLYLYSCDAAGKIINYVATSWSGNSYTTYDRGSGGPVEEGVAYFNMLRPGHYIAKGYMSFANLMEGAYEKELASTEPFEVKPGEGVVVAEMVSHREFLHIQTHRQADNSRNTADVIIRLYNSLTGGAIYTIDVYTYDTMTILLPLPTGEYWVQISPYKEEDSILGLFSTYRYLNGDYALCITKDPSIMPNPAPGTYANPGPNGLPGSLSASRATAQAVEMDKIYYGRLNDANATETSVPNGNWYKFELK